MKEIFQQKLQNVTFDFERIFYSNDELYYHITFDNNGKAETFRVKKDEEGMWKILAQVLPIWVHDLEMKFNDIITSNETGRD